MSPPSLEAGLIPVGARIARKPHALVKPREGVCPWRSNTNHCEANPGR